MINKDVHENNSFDKRFLNKCLWNIYNMDYVTYDCI